MKFRKAMLCCVSIGAALSAAPAAAATFNYNGSGGSLPDLVDFRSNIVVTDAFEVGDVNLTLNNFSHTFWADLQISLIRNGVETVLIAQNNGGGSDPNGTFTFDDEAATSVVNVNTTGGSFRPISPLSAFDGDSSAAAWQLRILDQAGLDSGRLGSWTLTLSTAAVPEPSTWAMLILGFGGVGGAMRRRLALSKVSRARLHYV
jgi:subtilisin-like proprotein convertase family protein